eukprot:360622-Chlamydomonas_euryale.AAC.7
MEWVKARGDDLVIPFSGAYENRLFDMPDDEAKALVAETKVPSMLPKIISNGFKVSLYTTYCKQAASMLATTAPPNLLCSLWEASVWGPTAIHLIYFFTAGDDEVKCWQIRKGTKAPQAAGTIHTDFERGFICAEVMTYEDLHELGSENAVKASGKYRQQGKEYVVQDGDIIFFKFNVTTKGK